VADEKTELVVLARAAAAWQQTAERGIFPKLKVVNRHDLQFWHNLFTINMLSEIQGVMASPPGLHSERGSV
jgi:hypothetical protein